MDTKTRKCVQGMAPLFLAIHPAAHHLFTKWLPWHDTVLIESGHLQSMKPMALVVVLCSGLFCPAVDAGSSNTSTIYDPDPGHLWNRLNEALFARTAPDGNQFGLDEPDILYRAGTKHLLTAPSRQRAVQVLDEFIHSHVRKPFGRTEAARRGKASNPVAS